MSWKLFEKTSEALGLLDWLGWQLGWETTDRLLYCFYCLKVAENTKKYGHGERARTTHPCSFEWKVAPASDTDECSHFSWLDAPEWSIRPVTPGWSIWRHYSGSSPVVVCTYWSPQRETNPSAPHQTHSFTSRGRTQGSLQGRLVPTQIL